MAASREVAPLLSPTGQTGQTASSNYSTIRSQANTTADDGTAAVSGLGRSKQPRRSSQSTDMSQSQHSSNYTQDEERSYSRSDTEEPSIRRRMIGKNDKKVISHHSVQQRLPLQSSAPTQAQLQPQQPSPLNARPPYARLKDIFTPNDNGTVPSKNRSNHNSKSHHSHNNNAANRKHSVTASPSVSFSRSRKRIRRHSNSDYTIQPYLQNSYQNEKASMNSMDDTATTAPATTKVDPQREKNADGRCTRLVGDILLLLEPYMGYCRTLFNVAMFNALSICILLIISRATDNKLFHSSVFASNSDWLLIAANLMIMFSYSMTSYFLLRVCLSMGCILFMLWGITSTPLLLDTSMFNVVMLLLNIRHALILLYDRRYIRFEPAFEQVYTEVFQPYLKRTDFAQLVSIAYMRHMYAGDVFKQQGDLITSLCILVTGKIEVVRQKRGETVQQTPRLPSTAGASSQRTAATPFRLQQRNAASAGAGGGGMSQKTSSSSRYAVGGRISPTPEKLPHVAEEQKNHKNVVHLLSQSNTGATTATNSPFKQHSNDGTIDMSKAGGDDTATHVTKRSGGHTAKQHNNSARNKQHSLVESSPSRQDEREATPPYAYIVDSFKLDPDFINVCKPNEFVEAPQWVNAKLNPDNSRYDVGFRCLEDCSYIKWPRENLVSLIQSNQSIATAIQAVLGVHTAKLLLRSIRYRREVRNFQKHLESSEAIRVFGTNGLITAANELEANGELLRVTSTASGGGVSRNVFAMPAATVPNTVNIEMDIDSTNIH